MPRTFDSTEPQAGDDLNTILAKRLQSLGGTSRWGATDEEIQAELSRYTATRVQEQLNQLTTDTDQLQTAIVSLPATLSENGAESADLTGDDWTLRTQSINNGWEGVAYGNGRFVAVSFEGASNRVMTSDDGSNWTTRTSAEDNHWISVCYGNGLFVAVSTGGTHQVMTSPDGIDWTPQTAAVVRSWAAVTYGAGLFVATAITGTGNRVMTSPNGIDWTAQTVVPDRSWVSVVYNGSIFVAVAGNVTANNVITSTDGITWTPRNDAVAAATAWTSVAYGAGLFVAVATNAVMTSPDGITWTTRVPANSNQWISVTYGGGRFVAIAQDGTGNRVMTSSDGKAWTPRSSAADNQWTEICYGSGMFVAVSYYGGNGTVMTSGSYGSDVIVPSARKIDWPLYAGVVGGIPTGRLTYTTLDTIDNTGAADVRAAIQTALDACPVDKVVVLPAGTFKVGGELFIWKGITLRGAGMGSTIIKGSTGSNDGPGHGIIHLHPNPSMIPGATRSTGIPNGQVAAINISSGAVRGSTAVTLATSNSDLHTGYLAHIDQTDDGTFVDNSGVDTPPRADNDDRGSSGGGTHHNSQLVKITNIAAGVALTFTPPLVWDFTRTPQLYFKRSDSGTVNTLQRAGVEDLTLQLMNPNNAANVNQNNLQFTSCEECWAKNVRSKNANSAHLLALKSFKLEIRGCTFDASTWAATGGGYGCQLDYQTSFCKVEDNIFTNTRDFVKTDAGAIGNVVLYNYHITEVPMSAAPTYTVATGGAHSAHPMFNLFEGNVTYTPRFDHTWGSSSHQTLLRNWFRGPMSWARSIGAALKIDNKATYYNVVGNVLGSTLQRVGGGSGWSTRTSTRISPQSGVDYSTWMIGYWSDYDTTESANAASQWANTIAAGNFDYIASDAQHPTGMQMWYNGASSSAPIPSSFFYTTKPSFFGALTWPPVDPVAPTVGEQVIPAGYRYAHGAVPGEAFVDFENGSEGATITPTILGNGTHGSIGTWQTTTNPEAQTQGTTNLLTITSNASAPLFNAPANIKGTIYTGSGTRGMRAVMSGNQCAQLTIPSPYPTTMSVGFFFRWNGPHIGSERDIVFFQDGGGNFQIMKLVEYSSPATFVAHTQNGTGNAVTFARDTWYWVTILRTAAGGQMKISMYNPASNYSLVGTSTLGVPSGTSGVKYFWFGCSKYAAGGSQSVDYDNMIINTNGVFPLGPSGDGTIGVNP